MLALISGHLAPGDLGVWALLTSGVFNAQALPDAPETHLRPEAS